MRENSAGEGLGEKLLKSVEEEKKKKGLKGLQNTKISEVEKAKTGGNPTQSKTELVDSQYT